MTQPRLCLIPGTMCDHRLWFRLAPLLAPHFDTEHVPIHDAHDHDSMLAMIHHAVGEGAWLLGYSLGGYLSLQYLIQHHDKVRGLILVASSALGLPEHERANRRGILKWLQTHDYEGMTPKRLAQFIHPSQLLDPEVSGVVRDMDRDLGKPVLMTQLRETSTREDLRAQLMQINTPCLIVGGSDDKAVLPDELHATKLALQGSQLHLLEHTAHMVPLEQPELLAQAILGFYRQTPQS